jgi:biofilm PGA synthesis N-glycosyltransferase PgaC
MNVSICVPAHNEAANIRRLLAALLEQETRLARIVEIMVVASGCTDETAEVARQVGRGRPGMHVHVQERREGKVAAINAYLKLRDPRSDVTVVCSADLDLARDVVEKLVASSGRCTIACRSRCRRWARSSPSARRWSST